MSRQESARNIRFVPVVLPTNCSVLHETFDLIPMQGEIILKRHLICTSRTRIASSYWLQVGRQSVMIPAGLKLFRDHPLHRVHSTRKTLQIFIFQCVPRCKNINHAKIENKTLHSQALLPFDQTLLQIEHDRSLPLRVANSTVSFR